LNYTVMYIPESLGGRVAKRMRLKSANIFSLTGL
jgi:hypothetical protein